MGVRWCMVYGYRVEVEGRMEGMENVWGRE